MSALSALLFTTNVEIKGTVGVFAMTLGGSAVLWLATLIVFSFVFPEPVDTGRYKLRLNLLFAQDNPPNPLSEEAKVTGYVQRPNQSAAAIDESIRVDRGIGGLVANFDNLQLGDKLYIITKYRDRSWRSDDMVIPTAQLQMNSAPP